MEKLLAAMYPCIGSTTANNVYLILKDGTEMFLQYFLNRNGIPLLLPAVVQCTIVGYLEEVSQN
jgi:hypothetical protein